MKSTALSALNNNLLSVSNVTQFLVVNPAISCKNPVVLAIVNRAAQRCRHWFGQEADVNFERKFALLLTDYIASLPTLVAEFNSLCERNGWLNIAHQTNQIIVSFLQQNSEDQADIAVVNALNIAYFSHRLIEELHDHMMCRLGKPETSWNMTGVNILAHQAIGEAYAATLDQTVIELVDKLIINAPTLTELENNKNQTFIWPCFCEQHGLSLAC